MKTIRKAAAVTVGLISVLLLHAVAQGAASAASGNTLAVNSETMIDWRAFKGHRMGVKQGTIYDGLVQRVFETDDVLQFDNNASLFESLLQGRVDAVVRDLRSTKAALEAGEYPTLTYMTLPVDAEGFTMDTAGISMDQQTIDDFNEMLADLKADGTYAEMIDRWFTPFEAYAAPQMPDIPSSGANGVFNLATSSEYIPFSFIGDGGRHTGFDVELAERFAARLGKTLNISDMAFGAIIPDVVSRRADLGLSGIAITEERKQSVLFTDPYTQNYSALVFPRSSPIIANNSTTDTMAPAESVRAPINWLREGIHRNLIVEGRWRLIVNGLGVTMLVALAAQVLGTVVGGAVAFVLTRSRSWVRRLGTAYTGLMHGIPAVVVLMLAYYVLFASTPIPSILVAIIAFTFIMGANIGEQLVGGIATVDPVEIEAARALGFSPARAFRSVTLPQAIRNMLSSYTTGFIELVKGTSIVGFIALQDLTRAGDIIMARTYDAYFPLVLVALIYLVVTLLCVQIFKAIRRRVIGEKLRPA